MTTYRIPDGDTFSEYTAFTRYLVATCDVTYVPLLIAENRVRFFALSTLVEVKSPFETGMMYGCAIPQDFDTGLDYCYPMPVLTVVLTPEMAAHVNQVIGVEIMVRKPVAVSLWTESMVA